MENRDLYYRLKFRALNCSRNKDQETQDQILINLLQLQSVSTQLIVQGTTKNYVGFEAQI